MVKKGIMALAVAACLILSACGGNTPAETETPAVTPEAVVTPEPTPELTPELTPEPTPVPTFAIDTDRHDAIYNHDSVKAVYLHMNRAELEADFEPGEETENGFIPYDEYGFFVKYYGNDTVKELIIFEKDTWQSFNGITCGSTVAELTAAYGKPLSSDNDVYAYYTLENELLSEMPSLAEVNLNYLYSVNFVVTDGIVTCVMLSRF